MVTNLANRLVAALPLRLQRTARQFAKFFATGIIGTIVDYAVFNLLLIGFGWDTIYHLGPAPIIGANLASVPLAILSNFTLNKYWTFRDNSQAVLQQGVSYFALNIVTFSLNQVLTGYFAFRLSFLMLMFPSDTLRSNVAKALAIGIILFINFFGSKFVIFRKRPASATLSPQ